MIKIENTEVVGWEQAIRGMRNPMNSWSKSDSLFFKEKRSEAHDLQTEPIPHSDDNGVIFGSNDLKLMEKLASNGPVHAKYRRMIVVYMDITAPLYWWKEFDTYKVGTVANSCSTMYKITDKEFTMDDFSHEHLFYSDGIFYSLIKLLNFCRNNYIETKDKDYWWQIIQLLPSSYNQKRTVMLNYEVLSNIYHSRKNHKLDEWRDFCKFIETDIPLSQILITI